MSKYTAEQVERAADLEQAKYDGDLIISGYLRDYATILRERESAKARVTHTMIREAKDAFENSSARDATGWWRSALEAVAPMLAKLRKHDFYNAGEVDCPSDIKCSNGELHTLRCRNCGLDNPDGYCSPLNQEKEHPVARVTISESGKFSIQALPGMAIKLRNGQELYSSPMLASARVPDARKLRLNGNVRQQSYDQGWNACRSAMLDAAPKPETER